MAWAGTPGSSPGSPACRTRISAAIFVRRFVELGRLRPLSLTVPAAQAELTLAALVREMLPGTSWSQAKELCAGGRVQVDGAPATDPARRMSAGERVEIQADGAALRERALTDLVVHLDADVVVVRKPAGILTVPFERDDRDTLLALARVAVRRIEAARGKETSPTLRAVQRLDKETSGLVVFARTVAGPARPPGAAPRAHACSGATSPWSTAPPRTPSTRPCSLADRGDGLRGSWGVFRAPRGEAAARGARGDHPRQGGGAAGRGDAGRLRAGDRAPAPDPHPPRRGRPSAGRARRSTSATGAAPLLPAPRPMLHAAVLGFVHPRTGKRLRFEEPPPEDFAGRAGAAAGERKGTTCRVAGDEQSLATGRCWL